MVRAVAARTDSAIPPPRIATVGHYGTLQVVAVDLKAGTASFRAASPNGSIGPETAVPLSMVRPLSQEDHDPLWNLLSRQLIEDIRQEGLLPRFYKDLKVFTGDDSSGEPALFLKLFVDAPKGLARDSTVSRWNDFAHLVQQRLLGLRLQRQPYVLLGAWG